MFGRLYYRGLEEGKCLRIWRLVIVFGEGVLLMGLYCKGFYCSVGVGNL